MQLIVKPFLTLRVIRKFYAMAPSTRPSNLLLLGPTPIGKAYKFFGA